MNAFIKKFLRNYKKTFSQKIKIFFLTVKKSSRNYKKILHFFKNFLFRYSIRMVNISRNKKRTNAKKRGILRILSAPVRYIKSKAKSVFKKLTKKEPKKN